MSEQTKFCMFCGQKIPANAKFCKFCGKPVASSSTPSMTQMPEPAKPIEPVTPIEPVKPVEVQRPSHVEETVISPMGRTIETNTTTIKNNINDGFGTAQTSINDIKNSFDTSQIRKQDVDANFGTTQTNINDINNAFDTTQTTINNTVNNDPVYSAPAQEYRPPVEQPEVQTPKPINQPTYQFDNVRVDDTANESANEGSSSIINTSAILNAINQNNTQSIQQPSFDETANNQAPNMEAVNSEAPRSTKRAKAKKKKKGGAGKVILIILLVLVILIGSAIGGSYLFRSQLAPMYPDGGYGLPFDYVLEIPWLQDAKDKLTQNDPTVLPTIDSSASPAQATTGTEDVAIASDDLIEQALKKELGDNPSAADYAKITSICVNGDAVTFNQAASNAVNAQTGSVDLQVLNKCTNVTTVSIKNVSYVTTPVANNTSVKTLEIANSNFVIENGEGMQNFSALTNLTIQNTNLSDLTAISYISSLQSLKVNNNIITSTGPIKTNMTNLRYCSIYGNVIWDYRGLANVETVDIWGKGATDQNSIYTMDRDYNSRQLQVLVSDLRIRTSPSSAVEDNILDQRAINNAYYYILDEYWDDSMQMTWYKVGNNMWVASKEGSWTKLYE